jgi:hypothetical protein
MRKIGYAGKDKGRGSDRFGKCSGCSRRKKAEMRVSVDSQKWLVCSTMSHFAISTSSGGGDE